MKQEENTGNGVKALTLGYAGSVAYGYGEALVALIPVLREVGARILISTPRPPEKLKELLEAIDVVEWMPHRVNILEMWQTMQERAAVMILPYSNPAGDNELLYRTHFPSKLTEYMALGMPVVVSGPEFATGVRYGKGGGGELAVGSGQLAEGREMLKCENAEKLKVEEKELAVGSRQLGGTGKLKAEKLKNENAEKDALFQHFSISEFLNLCPNGVVSCTTREELVACLQRLKADGELRVGLAKLSVEAGMRDFDPVKIREGFWDVLKEEALINK